MWHPEHPQAVDAYKVSSGVFGYEVDGLLLARAKNMMGIGRAFELAAKALVKLEHEKVDKLALRRNMKTIQTAFRKHGLTAAHWPALLTSRVDEASRFG